MSKSLDKELSAWAAAESVSEAALEQMTKMGYSSLDNLAVAYAGVPDGIKSWEGENKKQLDGLQKDVPGLNPVTAMKLLKLLGKKNGLSKKSGGGMGGVVMLLSLLVLAAGGAIGYLSTRPDEERKLVIDKVVGVVNTSVGVDISPYIDTMFASISAIGSTSTGAASGTATGTAHPKTMEELITLVNEAKAGLVIDLNGAVLQGPIEKALRVRADGLTIKNGRIIPEPPLETVIDVRGDNFKMEGITLKGPEPSVDIYNGFQSVGLVKVQAIGAVITQSIFTGGNVGVSAHNGATVNISSCQLSGVSIDGEGSQMVLTHSKISLNRGAGASAASGAVLLMNDTEISGVLQEGVTIVGENAFLEAHRINIFDAEAGALWAGDGAQVLVFDSRIMGGKEDSVTCISAHVKLVRCKYDSRLMKQVGGQIEEVESNKM